jgi:hypothetical protein
MIVVDTICLVTKSCYCTNAGFVPSYVEGQPLSCSSYQFSRPSPYFIIHLINLESHNHYYLFVLFLFVLVSVLLLLSIHLLLLFVMFTAGMRTQNCKMCWSVEYNICE